MPYQNGLAALVQNNDVDEIITKTVREMMIMNEMEKFPKIALGTWSWGMGSVGGDQVFGNHLGEADLRDVFDAAMKEGLNLWDTATVYGMCASEDILGAFAGTCP